MSTELKVDILLGTYNGSQYIVEQIESILNQSHNNFHLFIRDDGSTDNTIQLVEKFRDNRISLIRDDLGNVGVAENFRILLSHAESPYAMFSDQDDVWFLDKVAEMIAFISHNELESSPCLAYSPGIIVDSELKHKNKNTSISTVCRPLLDLSDSLFLNGGIQGCAMIFNKTLYQNVLREKFDWYMHDQAITLFTLCFGHVFFYHKPLFYYRQHSNNVVGFRKLNIIDTVCKYLFHRDNSFLVNSKVKESVHSFYRVNKFNLTEKDRNSLESFISLDKIRMIKFIYFSLRYNWNLNGSILRLLAKALLCKRLSE